MSDHRRHSSRPGPRDGDYSHSSSQNYRDRPIHHHNHSGGRHHSSLTDLSSRGRAYDHENFPSSHHPNYKGSHRDYKYKRYSPERRPRSGSRSRSKSRTPERSRKRDRRDIDSRHRASDYGASSRTRDHARHSNWPPYRPGPRDVDYSHSSSQNYRDRPIHHQNHSGDRHHSSLADLSGSRSRGYDHENFPSSHHPDYKSSHRDYKYKRYSPERRPRSRSKSRSKSRTPERSRKRDRRDLDNRHRPNDYGTTSKIRDAQIEQPIPTELIPLPATPRILNKKARFYQRTVPRSVNVYTDTSIVGEGTFGQVYKARDQEKGTYVALKRVRLETERDGFPITAVREIKILRQLNHKNIVNLIEIVTDKTNALEFRNDKGSFYLVFEYMDHDLSGLLSRDEVKFTESNIAHIMHQLLDGLKYCHGNDFLHRDIKCSNILVNNDGQVKLADFGLARLYNSNDKERPYTNKVITLWYRPPELLLGEERYGKPVDVWSCGCILGELFTRSAMFDGKTELCQLEKIFSVCGSPNSISWPEARELRDYSNYHPKAAYTRRLKNIYSDKMSAKALDLLDNMLLLDPKRRISADAALEHDWFKSISMEPANLPRDCDWHEMSAKKEQRRKRHETSNNQAHPHVGSIINV